MQDEKNQEEMSIEEAEAERGLTNEGCKAEQLQTRLRTFLSENQAYRVQKKKKMGERQGLKAGT